MMSNKQIVLGIGGLACLTFMLALPPVWSNIGEIVKRQAASNERLIEWKAAYQALLPVNQRWDKTFISLKEVPDQLSLTRVVNVEQYGLRIDTDRVTQVGSEEVLLNGMPVGLQKLCIGTGMQGLEMSSDNISNLRRGMQGLAARPDLELGTIEYAYVSGKDLKQPDTYVARVEGFCVRVRVSNEVAL